MGIIVTGLNHRNSTFSVREALALTNEQLSGALEQLRDYIDHGVILSTCNRTEIYTTSTNQKNASLSIDRFIECQFGVKADQLGESLYKFEDEKAVEHLYRVAGSLDSLILGESEILGQVRHAYSVASEAGLASGVLAHVFHNALRVGKRVRTETNIGRNALSVSRAAIETAKRIMDDLQSIKGIIVGAGDASRLAGQALNDAGVSNLVVVNRTEAHGQFLANQLGGTTAPFSDLDALIETSDLIVSATGAQGQIVNAHAVEIAMKHRVSRPLVILDMAMPRDIDPNVAKIPGVHLFTMYDLELVAEENRKERALEAIKAESIVQLEMNQFREWWRTQAVIPTIKSIRNHVESVRKNETSRSLNKLSELSDEQREVIEKLTKSIVTKILDQPTRKLKDRNDQRLTQAARELFEINDDSYLT